MNTIQNRLITVLLALAILAVAVLLLTINNEQQVLGRQINVAGAQRMLSQRVAKIALSLSRAEVRRPELQRELNAARKRFDTQLAALSAGSKELELVAVSQADNQSKLTGIRLLWSEFDKKLEIVSTQPGLPAKNSLKAAVNVSNQLRLSCQGLLEQFQSADASTRTIELLEKVIVIADSLQILATNINSKAELELSKAQLEDKSQTLFVALESLTSNSQKSTNEELFGKDVAEEIAAIRELWMPVKVAVKQALVNGQSAKLVPMLTTLKQKTRKLNQHLRDLERRCAELLEQSLKQLINLESLTRLSLKLVLQPDSISLQSELQSSMASFEQLHASLKADFNQLHTSIRNDEKTQALFAKCQTQWSSLKRHLESLVNACPALAREQSAIESIVTSNDEILARSHAVVTVLESSNTMASQFVKSTTVIIIALMIIVISLSYFLVINPVLGHITNVMRDVRRSSTRMNSVAAELKSSSLNLSDAANIQASSLEETSASMEEMAGMTNQNADFARQAGEMANKTKAAIANGEESVIRMISAMEQISASSRKVQKIVRSIQEIAFQTNILSLNAALEAASAGESGQRFTVVADEIRALARRTAGAAEETVELIGKVASAIVSGADIATDLSQRFQDVKQSTQDVSNMVLEIREASSEQAHGISQVNMAIMQMDRITQTNAATAEETANSAQQLTQQSTHLILAVHQLSTLFGVDHKKRGETSRQLVQVTEKVDSPMPETAAPQSAPVMPESNSDDPDLDDSDDSGFVRF